LTTSWDTPPEDGREAFRRANDCRDTEDFECALDYYTQAIELGFEPVALIYNSRAKIYKELGQVEAAIADCEMVLSLPDLYDTTHSSATRELKELRDMAAESTPGVIEGAQEESQVAVREGRDCLMVQDYICAIDKFNAAIELDPTNPDAYYNRAIIQLMIQNYANALADCTEALTLDPTHTDAYFARSYLFVLTGDYPGALDDLDKLIELEPENALAYSNRANVYLEGWAKYDEAIADGMKAIALDPTYADAHYNLGNAYRGKGESEQAIQSYSQAVSLDPTNADAYINRGLTYGDVGKYEEAVVDFERALQLNPQDAVAYMGRGSAYEQLGETEKAIADFKQALALPDDPANETHTRSQAGLERLGEE